MRRGQKGLLVIICAGMALSWIHSWLVFAMPILGVRPFSILDGAAILAFSMGITSLHHARGWRTAYVLGIEAIGLWLAVCRAVYLWFDRADSFWSGKWLGLFFARQTTFAEWVGVSLALFWTVTLWIAGVRLVVKRPDPVAVSARFDLGAAAFLTLLLIQLIMIGKGVPVNPDPSSAWSFLAFVMLGLVALGMGGDADGAEKSYMTPYGRLGAVLSFLILVLLAGGGLTILFLPSLMSAAEATHDLIKAAARPLVPVLISGLRFIFLGGCRKVQEGCAPSGQASPGSDLTVGAGEEPGLLHTIVTWGFVGLAGAIGAAVICLVFAWLIQWLLSRRPAGQERLSLWQALVRILRRLQSSFLSLPGRLAGRRKARVEGLYLYARLQRWGGHCGLPRAPSETPMEYGFRLAERFPVFRNDVSAVVTLYNRMVYGVTPPEKREIVSARDSLKRMGRPRHWPARIRTWFMVPSRE